MKRAYWTGIVATAALIGRLRLHRSGKPPPAGSDLAAGLRARRARRERHRGAPDARGRHARAARRSATRVQGRRHRRARARRRGRHRAQGPAARGAKACGGRRRRRAGVPKAADKARRDLERGRRLRVDEVATEEQVENLTTAYNVARANLRTARFNAQFARIEAPADGIVFERLVEGGELVQPGQPVVVLGATGSGWVVRIGLADRDAVRIEPGAARRGHVRRLSRARASRAR